MFKRVKSVRNTSAYIPGNSVKLIRGGAEYFDLLERLISTASHTIHFQVYIYDDDATGNRISTALKEAAVRGVKVYIMLDAYASKNLSRAYIKDLTNSGIHFKWFAPLLKGKKFYLGRRLHHKVIVIDSCYSMVAGLNISDKYNDTIKAIAWLDWALYVEGPIGEVLAATCIRRYKARISPTLNDKPKPLSIASLTKNCEVRARINDWIGRKKEISQSYLEMFETAKDHIIIMSPYFLPGALFRNAIKAATKRGVKIKVILAGLSDIGTSKYAERYLYRWLFQNNVEIYEYSKTVLHGKIAACDATWVTIGSYNLNNLSAYASVELNLDVANSSFAKDTEDCLTRILETECEQITEEQYYRATSWLAHVMQKLAYNIMRLVAFFVIKKRE